MLRTTKHIMLELNIGRGFDLCIRLLNIGVRVLVETECWRSLLVCIYTEGGYVIGYQYKI
uniref:Uncharacterized protein n=1 Tax=viral metagenome TaxID=1070528 RepID=A0A6M3JHF6_9ZZZZ